jgi:hypothetical protein
MNVALFAPLLLLAARCGQQPVDDTDPDTDTPLADAPVSDLQATVHDEIGSLVTARWDQLEACSALVRYRLEGEAWRESPTRQLEAGEQEQLLLGLPFGVEVELRVVNDCGQGALHSATIAVQTAPLPEGLPHAAVVSSEETRWDDSLQYLLTSIDSREDASDPNASWTIILDRQGRTVWALATPHQRVTMAPHVAADGTHLLVDHNSFWALFDSGDASQVLRVDLDGTERELIDTPGLHHPLAELPDGTVAWGSLAGFTETLELCTPGGEQTTLWSCQGFHQELGSLLPCAGNTLSYHSASDSFLFSFYSTDTVLQLDATSGESLRWFGHLEGSWSFEPEDSAFYWQHGAVYTEAGTLLTSTADAEPGSETLVREYELDHDTETLRQVWSFGEGQGIYGDELGEAWRLPGGNTLHNMGTAQRLREITPEGDVVWDLSWSRGSYIGRSEPIEDLYTLWP